MSFPRLEKMSFRPKEEIIVFDSFGELLDKGLLLFGAEKSRKENCRYFFRGECAFYDYPDPGIFRGFLSKEKEIFQHALNHCPNLFRHAGTTFDKLCEMDHYGFPARLLDVSSDLAMSWFMAVDGMHLKDLLSNLHSGNFYYWPGVLVIRVPESRIKFVDSDLVSILSNVARMNKSFNLGELFHEVNQERVNAECNYFDVEDFSSNWLVYPRLDNSRVKRQKGAFILHGLLPEVCSDLLKKGINGKGDRNVDKETKDFKTNSAFPQMPVDFRGNNKNDIVRCARLVPSENYYREIVESVRKGASSYQDIARLRTALDNFKQKVFDELSFVGGGEIEAYEDDYFRQSNVCRAKHK